MNRYELAIETLDLYFDEPREVIVSILPPTHELAEILRGKGADEPESRAEAIEFAFGDDLQPLQPDADEPEPEAESVEKVYKRMPQTTGVDPKDDAYFGSPVTVNGETITVGASGQPSRPATWMPGVDSRDEAVYLIDRALAPNDQRYLVPVTYASRIDDVDGLVVLEPVGARKPPANVGRFDADWVEQAAVLDYICAVNRDDFQLAAHPDDPDRPILTTTGGAFTTSHSPFVREWAGKELSAETMRSLHSVGADSVLWRDIEDCIGGEQAAAARERVNVLAQAGRIPPEAA